ncbi:T9SS type A sorting domain-containing protein, partial [bacterium]|nr:T9SS type A sorting domain-containing protein [bacterium]
SIMAPENYNGVDYPIIVSAGDNAATAVDTFMVTVNSINDPPTAFGLVEPVNNYIAINPWIVFKWEASVDEVEDSTIYYTLTITFDDTTQAPLVKTGLTVTELIMGRIEMYNSDDSTFTGEDTTYAEWSIEATDGEANITSSQTFTLIIPPVGVIEEEPELPPTSLKLGPVYPNPFNDQTRIEYELPWDGLVEVVVYDLAGRVVKTLVNDNMTVGRYTARWDGYNEYGKRSAAGLYLCRLKVGDSDRMVQIILLR